jgi:hypothetical protein
MDSTEELCPTDLTSLEFLQATAGLRSELLVYALLIKVSLLPLLKQLLGNVGLSVNRGKTSVDTGFIGQVIRRDALIYCVNQNASLQKKKLHGCEAYSTARAMLN